MRIRELHGQHLLVALTNEEVAFLKKHKTPIIDLKSLEDRESRIAENLIFKDILCKIDNERAMVNEYVSSKN